MRRNFRENVSDNREISVMFIVSPESDYLGRMDKSSENWTLTVMKYGSIISGIRSRLVKQKMWSEFHYFRIWRD